MNYELPDFSLIVLIGASGSGKSTFAARHFLETEVLSSDRFRGLVSDDETSQEATTDAFEALHHLAGIRLRRRRMVVVDATNVQENARKPLLELARQYHAVPVAIVLDVPERLCLARNASRPDRNFGKHVVERHCRELRRGLRNLRREGFRYVFHLDGEEAIESAAFTRAPLWTDKRSITGEFDIIGDIHGCYDELCTLLGELGYGPDESGVWRHPEGRRLVFVGDLVDRGPKIVECANLVMDAVAAGAALCVPGNHDDKLKRALQGRNVQVTHGLGDSLAQIEALPEEERGRFRERFAAFVDGLVSHLWLDGGRLVVAHAGVKAQMIGRASGKVREFALYGETTGETDEFGLPVRWNWAAEYRDPTCIVYGHTPVPAAEWLNNTINIDTGCVFGGALTALRWPERQIVTTPARMQYAEPVRPLTPAPEAAPDLSLQWRHDDLLDIADVTGTRFIKTPLAGRLRIAEANAAAALEVISRYAAHPRWLIYLPPTMSPVETAPAGEYLEHPEQAWRYFAGRGVARVVCQEKHMGSRAVLIVCRDSEAARKRFGAEEGECGAIMTRTGRPFFSDPELTARALAETMRALTEIGLWDTLESDWVCLDAEIMPWNAKAQALLREQYAPVAAAGSTTLAAEIAVLEESAARGNTAAADLLPRFRRRREDLEAYRTAYARYCWQVNGLDNLRIAPFHILAAEGRTLVDRDHRWHIGTLAPLAHVSPLFQATENIEVETGDEASCRAGTEWWERRTGAGAEGMVVKPLEYIPPRGCQPAVKVRGREYLRIIYGPEYTQPEHLERLRARNVGAKRALASKEFALGIEALERFVRREPLRRVHECAFGVLAMESEPVDPRL